MASLTDGKRMAKCTTTSQVSKPLEEKRVMYVVLTSHQPAEAARCLLDLWKNFLRESSQHN